MSFANVTLVQQLNVMKNKQLCHTVELWARLFWFSLAGNTAVKLEPTNPESADLTQSARVFLTSSTNNA